MAFRYVRSLKRLQHKTLPYEEWGEIQRINCSNDQPQFGIEKGDVLIVQPGARCTEGEPAVWCVLDGEFLTIACAFNNFGDVGLDQMNGVVNHYHPRDVVFYGMIKAIEKPIKIRAVEQEKLVEIPKEEITAVCECGATLTGRPDFLRAMGWRLKKSETLCMGCW